MPRRTKSQPSYLHHKPSNQAYVRVNGRMIYLGVYDTAESHRRYAATITDLNAGTNSRGRKPTGRRKTGNGFSMSTLAFSDTCAQGVAAPRGLGNPGA